MSDLWVPTKGQLARWAMFKRTPNDWAMRNVLGRPEGTIVGTTGRQVGKTDEASDYIDRQMNADSKPTDKKPEDPPFVGVVGPTFEKALISVERYIKAITLAFGAETYNLNQQRHELIITDPIAGKVNAKLKWMSAEEPMNVIGHTLSAYLIDEAQGVPDNVHTLFMPTMDVRDASGLIFGTPDSILDQTWFQGLWDAGQDPLDHNVHSFSVASWEAPWMNMDRIIENKKTMSPVDFDRLYGGRWVTNFGLVFPPESYRDSLIAEPPEWDGTRRVHMAVDLAITNDFNVVMWGDPLTRTMLGYERWNFLNPIETYDKILDIHDRLGRPKTWVDATGMGQIPARELAGHLGRSKVVPVSWNAGMNSDDNKMNAVRALAGDLQHRRTMFPASWTDARRELGSFIYQRTNAGKITAGARTNAHDDIVMTMVMLNKSFGSAKSGSGRRQNYLSGGSDIEIAMAANGY